MSSMVGAVSLAAEADAEAADDAKLLVNLEHLSEFLLARCLFVDGKPHSSLTVGFSDVGSEGGGELSDVDEENGDANANANGTCEVRCEQSKVSRRQDGSSTLVGVAILLTRVCEGRVGWTEGDEWRRGKHLQVGKRKPQAAENPISYNPNRKPLS